MSIKFTYWEEDGGLVGYLNDYPDTWTQGEDLDDPKFHLRDLTMNFRRGGWNLVNIAWASLEVAK